MNLPGWSTLARRLAHWVLALMLLSALAPAISRSLDTGAGGPPHPAPSGSAWIEVCGPGGIRWVQVSIDVGSEADELAHGLAHAAVLDHCALCGLSLDRCLLDPPLEAVSTAVKPLIVPMPGTYVPVATEPGTAWLARGPPV